MAYFMMEDICKEIKGCISDYLFIQTVKSSQKTSESILLHSIAMHQLAHN